MLETYFAERSPGTFWFMGGLDETSPLKLLIANRNPAEMANSCRE
jgi:hypothetical protein